MLYRSGYKGDEDTFRTPTEYELKEKPNCRGFSDDEN
jgi:hypothetical protein